MRVAGTPSISVSVCGTPSASQMAMNWSRARRMRSRASSVAFRMVSCTSGQ